MQTNRSSLINVSQLRVGLYIHLDVSWMDHPFTLSNFKITHPAQIDSIKKIGLKKLRYDPKRSDCEPLHDEEYIHQSLGTESQSSVELTPPPTMPKQQAISARLVHLHHAIDEAEMKFIAAGNVIRESTKSILVDPKTSIAQSAAIVNTIMETTLTEGDVAIHALNGNKSSDDHYLHPLNVTVLALMLAKSIGISPDETRILGLSAIFHDIGKIEISSKVLLKKEPLTKQEQAHFEQHSELGARMAKEVGLPARIGKIILQHHVHEDGTGYPSSILAEKTDPLAKIIALVNWYDNLCNPENIKNAKTPYEALSQMFAHQRSKFDEMLLKRFIKLLGIYPPGSVVQLSTGVYAIVITVNPQQTMRPFVMLHNPLMQREQPDILDLSQESNISISACIRPSQLPKEALDYLHPRKRLSYFVDADLIKHPQKD